MSLVEMKHSVESEMLFLYLAKDVATKYSRSLPWPKARAAQPKTTARRMKACSEGARKATATTAQDAEAVYMPPTGRKRATSMPPKPPLAAGAKEAVEGKAKEAKEGKKGGTLTIHQGK